MSVASQAAARPWPAARLRSVGAGCKHSIRSAPEAPGLAVVPSPGGRPGAQGYNATMEDPNVPGRRNIYDMSRAELEELVADLGMPAYRASQIWSWAYARLAPGFGAMTDISLAHRDVLAREVRFGVLEPAATEVGRDGSAVKTLYRLPDGGSIEAVLMHYEDADSDPDQDPDPDPGSDLALERTVGRAPPSQADAARRTVCVSTQVGCAMGCVFCATGQMGLVGDLGRGAVVEQVVLAARELAARGSRLSNIVFMGMGEPLANWPATWGAIETLTDSAGFSMSPRRLTVSTVGIVPGIRRLAHCGLPIRLAVSLHAADDGLRDQLVAANRVYPLADIIDACREYQQSGGRRITFEYVLINGLNDAPAQAGALASLLHGMSAHVNLIPLNPTDGSSLRPSSPGRAKRFAERLRSAGLPTSLRMRRGIEIAAGCGQLRSRDGVGRVGRTLAPAAPAPDSAPALLEEER